MIETNALLAQEAPTGLNFRILLPVEILDQSDATAACEFALDVLQGHHVDCHRVKPWIVLNHLWNDITFATGIKILKLTNDRSGCLKMVPKRSTAANFSFSKMLRRP